VSVAEAAPSETPESTSRSPLGGLDAGDRKRAVIIVILLALVLFALPARMSAYWTDVATQVAIFSVVSLGLGLLIGRVGMVSLGQVAVLALGAWVAARLSFATSLPFPLLILATGLITMVLGTLVGLPALRLSGLYLALITLMLAGAITVVLSAANFPNGGHGFLGHVENDFGNANVRRPDIANGDSAYFRYSTIVAVLMFLLALVHVRTKPGRAWAAIRQSEPAALAAGVNITFYKMWAFALASFMTGVAGCLFASQVGVPRVITFRTQDSLTLAATALIGGVFSIWGALVAAVFNQVLPFLFQAEWGINTNFLLIIFGVGLLQVLLTAPGGLSDQVPKDLARLWRAVSRPLRQGETA